MRHRTEVAPFLSLTLQLEVSNGSDLGGKKSYQYQCLYRTKTPHWQSSLGKNHTCKRPWLHTNYELTDWHGMKLQLALLKFLARSSSSTKGLNKSKTALMPYSGPLSGLDSHPQKSCESPTGEVTLFLGHRNSQVKIYQGTFCWPGDLDYRKGEGGRVGKRKGEWRQGEDPSSPPEAGKYKRWPMRTSGQGWKTSESESFSHLWECSQKIRLPTVKEGGGEVESKSFKIGSKELSTLFGSM